MANPYARLSLSEVEQRLELVQVNLQCAEQNNAPELELLRAEAKLLKYHLHSVRAAKQTYYNYKDGNCPICNTGQKDRNESCHYCD